jgi:hypothetical protein
MNAIRFTSLGVLAALGFLIAAASLHSEQKDAPEATPDVNDKQFHEKLLEVARSYKAFGRVDDEARWAPGLCRAPMEARARLSRSSDEATHGQKLYSILAKKRDDYFPAPAASTPVGQIVVKESWIPEEAKDLKKVPLRFDRGEFDFNPYVEHDGKIYKAAKRASLYIMMKLDPKTPDTDDGWIYGTVGADGKTVTSSGAVASCMKCHQTKKDRLFGLKPASRE